MNRFSVVGIGPGGPDYLLPAARKEVENSDVLAGGRRQLDLFKYTGLETFCLDGRFLDVVNFIKENRDQKKIAVLVSGDPGFYSLLGVIEKKFSKNEYFVIPGLSSMQLAFSRVQLEWKDAAVISLHGKPLNIIDKYIFQSRSLGILTDYRNTPFLIACYMREKGSKNRKIFIAENLSYPDERIIKTDMETIEREDKYSICIMIVV